MKGNSAASRLVLPDAALQFIARGGRDLELSRLGFDVAAGATVDCENADGDAVAWGIADPENDRLRIMGLATEGLRGAALLSLRVEAALTWRRSLGRVEPGSAYRLLHGAGDGVPGITCDVYADTIIVYAYSEAMVPSARQVADLARDFVRAKFAVLKIRKKGGAADTQESDIGAPPPNVITAHEAGVPFEIHPHGGLNVGLFTDMRHERQLLAPLMHGRRVLNLFAYTGAFSVMAAKNGAAHVTSVDTSDGVLAWAEANFGLSQLDTKRASFIAADAVRFLERARRDREQYDAILIDPPSFSTARGAPWAIKKDYPALITQAARVLSPRGLLWVASNHSELGPLPNAAAGGLAGANRAGALVHTGSLPPCFPTLATQAKDRYLQTALFRVE